MSKRDKIRDLRETLEKEQTLLAAEKTKLNAAVKQYRPVYDAWKHVQMVCNNHASVSIENMELSERQFRQLMAEYTNAQIREAVAEHDPKDIYNAVQPNIDKNGYHLSHAAEKLLNIAFYTEYVQEDTAGWLDPMNGFGYTKLLEAAHFGERKFEINGSYQLLSQYQIDTSSEEYADYQHKLYAAAIKDMASPGIHEVEDMLDALTNLKHIEPSITQEAHSDEWVTMSEHMQKYYSNESVADNIFERSSFEKELKEITDEFVFYFSEPTTPDEYETVNYYEPPKGGFFAAVNNVLSPQAQIDDLENKIHNLRIGIHEAKELTEGIKEMTLSLAEESLDKKELLKQEQSELNHFEKWLNKSFSNEFEALGFQLPLKQTELWSELSQHVTQQQDFEHVEVFEEEFVMEQ